MEVRDIPVDKLVPSRNLRTESGGIDELVESIREHGLLQPIRVRPTGKGLYQIIAGHRRFLSHRVLGLRTISAVVVEETDEAVAVQSIVENLQRENLTPLELAQGIRELATGFDLTSDKIGQAISKSPSQVRNWVRLSRLPDDVLEKIESGEGRQQIVTGLTPRHIQPFVSDLPSDEEMTRNPDAAALYENRIVNVRQLQQEIEERGIHINAHMADEVARRVKKEQATVAEAIDGVLANPQLYRPTHFPYKSAEELELDTWAAYRKILDEMRAIASRLRPDIAVGFRPDQKRDLLERLSVFFASLESYKQSLQHQDNGISSEPPQLAEGKSNPS